MRQKNKLNKWLLFILLLVLAATLYRRLHHKDGLSSDRSDKENRIRNFDREVRKNARLIYSKHARCRMNCRHIDESEVRDILENGSINRSKSELSLNHPRYALEGRTDDGQQIRIVVAKDQTALVLITCIDLQKEWKCNCD